MEKKIEKYHLQENYFLRIDIKPTNSNYNKFASIYKDNIKVGLLFGTCFKDTTPIKEIKKWALERLNAPHNKIFL